MAFTRQELQAGFRIGECLIEPRQNRIVRHDTEVRLEPRVMDVLVCLAERAGEVVSRDTLNDAGVGQRRGHRSGGDELHLRAASSSGRRPLRQSRHRNDSEARLSPDGAGATRSCRVIGRPISAIDASVRWPADVGFSRPGCCCLAPWPSASRGGGEVRQRRRSPAWPCCDSRTRPAMKTLDYLGLALPDEIATLLTKSRGLAVRPFGYVDGDDPLAAARARRVDHIVTGRYYLEDDKQLSLAIEAQHVRQERVIWRTRITAPAGDLLAMRGRIAEGVQQGLLPALGARSAPTSGSTPAHDEAYQLYLRSLALPQQPKPTERAIEMLERVVTLEPAFAPAWHALGPSLLRLRHLWRGRRAGATAVACRASQGVGTRSRT